LTQQHTISEGYYYNYVHDASMLYWTARWLELHKSLDEKDKMLDQLIIMRLRKAASDVLHQAQTGLGNFNNIIDLSKELNIETSNLEGTDKG
jgi:predicted S18 family serine protease